LLVRLVAADAALRDDFEAAVRPKFQAVRQAVADQVLLVARRGFEQRGGAIARSAAVARLLVALTVQKALQSELRVSLEP
jgi:hypothetical protein